MLIDLLYEHGLGDLLVLYEIDGVPTLCNITYDAGKIALRPQRHIKLNLGAQASDCKWDLLGVITKAVDEEWKGMTFLGLSHCNFDIKSNMAYANRIMNIKNQHGDNLVGFKGSVYRAYQLSLENDILPIISMATIKTKKGKYGLAVNNLSITESAGDEKVKIYQTLHYAVEKKLKNSIDEVNLPQESFANLFAMYV